ncbi:MAG: DUF362 domain-containing protein [Bacteroidales bacterium]|nr:DUF362 domain-containing protein [Bacteroidales bacterium]MBN2633471.1 DUF362 domain-containing protein [Bacteroidales bacterium]
MNNRVAARICTEYIPEQVYEQIRQIYRSCEGPDVKGKKVLLKPNILIDADPAKCISTHPVVVEAMAGFLISEGARVLIGDSPALHRNSFRGEKSGIADVCRRLGAEWVDFNKNPLDISLRRSRIKMARIIKDVDFIISLPKLKTHELVYLTGAVKNTLGLVPGFHKAKQHAIHYDRQRFAEFLVDLNEAVMPDFFLIDGIMGMEGPGPGQGMPVMTGVLLGSTNPAAVDILASEVAGYDPMDIPTTAVAVKRGLWLQDVSDVIYDGPDRELLKKKDFKRIPVTGNENIAFKFVKKRIPFIRKFDKRPVFIHSNCSGCGECISICSSNALTMHKSVKNHVIINDSRCIRCFCCAEVCQYHAVEIRRKVFGV